MRNKIIKGIVWILILISIVNISHAIGLAPSRNVIDFSPNSVQELNFRIINTENKDMAVAIYPRGELAQYVTLENNIVEINASDSEKTVKYKIKMPDKLEPGLRSCDFLVVEIPNIKNNDVLVVQLSQNKVSTEDGRDLVNEQNSMVTATVVLMHQLRVNVPYPGKYAQGRLYITEANVNETTTFTISLFNFGKEDIKKASATIVIKGPTNEEIAVIKTNEISLKQQEEGKVVAYWLANVGNGNYYAEVIANYDGETILLNKNFFVGNLAIDIEDLKVNNFKLGTIARFDILLRSKWNEEIPNVYANMQVIDKSGTTLTDFKTSSVNIEPKSTAEISGYWDTTNVQIGEYDVNVKLHYTNRTVERLFRTVVSIDKIEVTEALTGQAISRNTTMRDSILVIIVIILIGINIGWFVFFRRKKSR